MAENPRPVPPEAERHMDGDSSGRGSGHFAAELTEPWPWPRVEATTHPDARAVPRGLSAAVALRLPRTGPLAVEETSLPT